MGYSKNLYVLLLIIGILLYIAGLAYLYSMLRSFETTSHPFLDDVAGMRFDFKIKNVTIIQITNTTIIVNIELLANISWNNPVNITGPRIDFVVRNRSIASINIESLGKPILNKYVKLEFNLSEMNPEDKLYVKVQGKTDLLAINLTMGLSAVSVFVNYLNFWLVNTTLKTLDNTTRMQCMIYSNYIVDAPLTMEFIDHSNNTIYLVTIWDFHSSPDEPYKCSIDLPGGVIDRTDHIIFRLGSIRLSKFKLK